jgi:hypothetical protein
MKSHEQRSNFSLRNKCEAASKRANPLLIKIHQQQCLATTTNSTIAMAEWKLQAPLPLLNCSSQ